MYLRKGFIISLLLFISLFTLVGCGGKKAAEYKADLENATKVMFENAFDVEDMLEQYSEIWNYSIKSKGSITVEEMSVLTGIDQDAIEDHFVINSFGNILDDFSTNLYSMHSYFESNGQLEKVQEASEEAKDKMSELKDHPSDFEKVYDEALDLYDLTEEFMEMAINPTGSLQSFNEDKNRLSSEIFSKYKRIDVIMPE